MRYYLNKHPEAFKMARDEFVRMDRLLAERLKNTGTVDDRERLVIENLRRKQAIVAAERIDEQSGQTPTCPACGKIGGGRCEQPVCPRS